VEQLRGERRHRRILHGRASDDLEARLNANPKTVVVTGASGGLGRAVAIEFARRGWCVGLIARGAEGLEGARRDVKEAGGEPLVLQADVADAAAVAAAADEAVKVWGGLDVWVNCAMATVFSPVREMSPAEYRRVTEVTYLGYVHGTLAALKHMRLRNRGTIVQVGSALAYRAIPWQSAYCASKFAIRGFTDALRSELIHEHSGIRLSMVQCPGMNTPQFDWARHRLPRKPQPVAPVYQPEVAARAVYRAAQNGPRELWVGGSTIKAILGGMAVPAYLDRLLARVATKGQISNDREEPDPQDNLFTPVEGDFGAHGRFGSLAQDSGLMVSPGRARVFLALAGVAGMGLAICLLASARDGPSASIRRLRSRARRAAGGPHA
jgi:NAD(P)-dependent dehydrogenase (short-subunit alcohol dehydrogenase family)